VAILAECPCCHKKQSVRNKRCTCGANLDRLKHSRKVRYWISYRMPDGKQKREAVSGDGVNPYSIEDARNMESKRRVQKKEKKIFDVTPDTKMTFSELAEWYLGLEKIRDLKSYKTIQVYLRKFNKEFGNTIVADIKLADLEGLQVKRKREGLASKTIDDEINYVKGMVIKAFDNDLVSAEVLKAFRRVKRLLRGHANRRRRVLSIWEYRAILANAPPHLKPILITGYWTGMRKGEIINMTWGRVDLKNRFIRLEASDTKEKQGKSIPIGTELLKVLSKLPRFLHNEHVFLYNGRPILNRFETALSSACKAAGIAYGKNEKGGFIFHDLRHTFATDMRRAGVPRTVTMSIMGHAIRDMNERYDTVEDWEKLDAIGRLETYRRNVDQTVDQENLTYGNYKIKLAEVHGNRTHLRGF